ncbi:hypothetical protein KM043_005893 [Ampulex compressa]|nr:hypothetical protein KM043_005893 [Ampulex compressa]
MKKPVDTGQLQGADRFLGHPHWRAFKGGNRGSAHRSSKRLSSARLQFAAEARKTEWKPREWKEGLEDVRTTGPFVALSSCLAAGPNGPSEPNGFADRATARTQPRLSEHKGESGASVAHRDGPRDEHVNLCFVRNSPRGWRSSDNRGNGAGTPSRPGEQD